MLEGGLIAEDVRSMATTDNNSSVHKGVGDDGNGSVVAVDPFHEVSSWSAAQVGKTVVLLPLLIVRVVSMVALLVAVYLWIRVALLGVTDRALLTPLSRWRRFLLWPSRLGARVLLLILGYYYVRVKGNPAHRSVAPVIVSNHVGFVDPIFVFYRHLPMLVAARENVEMPVVGMYLRALQIVPVDRASAESRRRAAGNIRRRAIDNRWPHVMLFPEGTTTNGRAVISFKTGAFSPGLPVQPMVIRYPHKYANACWCDQPGGLLGVLFLLMTQFVNFMEVEYLPVMTPTVKEVKHPQEFADRVRGEMAKALGVPCTEHSFLDIKRKRP